MHYPTIPALALALSLTVLPAFAYKIPANVQAFYDQHKSGACSKRLSAGFTDGQSSTANKYYCGDAPNVIYLKGKDGQYDDMDIDCDGANHSEGKCSNDPSGQPVLAFDDELQGYDVGLQHLDAHIHPYVVFGNDDGNPTFKPEKYGVQPLSIIAVVCNGTLQYGIWGDTNGPQDTGEAALAMGQLCFGDDAVDADNGHTAHDVLYIAFEGERAVPGAKGANWRAESKEDFERSIKGLGDKLVAAL